MTQTLDKSHKKHSEETKPLLLHGRKLLRFALVGLSCAVIHYSATWQLVERYDLRPSIANILAFCLALIVSFWGQTHITFESEASFDRFERFSLSALVSFLMNQCLFLFFMHALSWDYRVALALVLLIVPCVTYFLLHYWVYAHEKSHAVRR